MNTKETLFCGLMDGNEFRPIIIRTPGNRTYQPTDRIQGEGIDFGEFVSNYGFSDKKVSSIEINPIGIGSLIETHENNLRKFQYIEKQKKLKRENQRKPNDELLRVEDYLSLEDIVQKIKLIRVNSFLDTLRTTKSFEELIRGRNTNEVKWNQTQNFSKGTQFVIERENGNYDIEIFGENYTKSIKDMRSMHPGAKDIFKVYPDKVDLKRYL